MPKLWKTLSAFMAIAGAGIVLWPEAAYTPHQPGASYLADSAAYPVASMPDDWSWSYHSAQDGTKLRWGKTALKESDRAVIVTVPGYTSSMDMYAEHVRLLAARGYHVAGLDLRGQGGSDRHRESHPEKLYAKTFGVYSDDLAGFIQSQKFDADLPVILLGSSFGGHVSLRMAADHETTVDGLVLLAPAYAPNTAPFPFWLTKAMTGFAGLIGKGTHYAPGQGSWVPDGTDLTQPSECASEPKRLYLRDTVYVRSPKHRVGGATNNYVSGMISSGELLQKAEYAQKIDLPIHMIMAEKDTIIDSDVSKRACQSGLPDCTLITLPGTGHCLLLETDEVLEQIFTEIDSLVDRLTEPAQP